MAERYLGGRLCVLGVNRFLNVQCDFTATANNAPTYTRSLASISDLPIGCVVGDIPSPRTTWLSTATSALVTCVTTAGVSAATRGELPICVSEDRRSAAANVIGVEGVASVLGCLLRGGGTGEERGDGEVGVSSVIDSVYLPVWVMQQHAMVQYVCLLGGLAG